MTTFQLDMSGMTDALQRYLATPGKDLAGVINQRTLNVIRRTLLKIPPFGGGNAVQAQRRAVQLYLRETISTRIKLATSGKRKGQFIRKGAKNKQLQRVHLILQARRAREGKPGLYGRKMLMASGRFKQRAQVGVGFSKSMWLPIIAALNAVVDWKVPSGETARIARWPGQPGYGKVELAKPNGQSDAVEVNFAVGMALKRRPDQESKVEMLEQIALQAGLNEEAAELHRHVDRKMGQRIREMGLAA